MIYPDHDSPKYAPYVAELLESAAVAFRAGRSPNVGGFQRPSDLMDAAATIIRDAHSALQEIDEKAAAIRDTIPSWGSPE